MSNKEVVRCMKTVFGVGRNDAGYMVTRNELIDGKRRQVWVCKFYRTWKSMLERAYCTKLHGRHATYKGCSVVPEWHSFSAFRAWMETQNFENMELDKDILMPGNKVYGPDTCVFVSARTNTFMLDCAAAKGEWPLGVSWNKQKSKFSATCNNPFSGKYEHLGYFSDPNAAHGKWRSRKLELALKLAELQTDERVILSLVSRFL